MEHTIGRVAFRDGLQEEEIMNNLGRRDHFDAMRVWSLGSWHVRRSRSCVRDHGISDRKKIPARTGLEQFDAVDCKLALVLLMYIKSAKI